MKVLMLIFSTVALATPYEPTGTQWTRLERQDGLGGTRGVLIGDAEHECVFRTTVSACRGPSLRNTKHVPKSVTEM